MTKEKILEKYPELEYDQVLKAMEEYGKQQYNRALDDAAEEAETDYYMEEEVCCHEINRQSILKLKKK